jgi:hypothetical protein
MGSAGPARFGAELDPFLSLAFTDTNCTSGKAVTKGLKMERFPVNIDAEQVVRWIMAEQATAPSTFKTTATRTTEVREIPARREYHLGDEEREDLSEVATLAALEIAPAHAGEGWLLTVAVEDEIGPRVSDDGGATETEQRIDIGTFYSAFIRPGRGTANVIAQVDSPSARTSVTRLLNTIERNQHAVERGPSRA